MDRRAFIGTLTGGLLAAPLAVKAQQAGKVYRIGLLIPAPAPAPGVMPPIVVPAFPASMRRARVWEGGLAGLPQRLRKARLTTVLSLTTLSALTGNQGIP